VPTLQENELLVEREILEEEAPARRERRPSDPRHTHSNAEVLGQLGWFNLCAGLQITSKHGVKQRSGKT